MRIGSAFGAIPLEGGIPPSWVALRSRRPVSLFQHAKKCNEDARAEKGVAMGRLIVVLSMFAALVWTPAPADADWLSLRDG